MGKRTVQVDDFIHLYIYKSDPVKYADSDADTDANADGRTQT